MSSAASRAAQIRLEEQLRSCLDRIAQLEARVAVLETDKESAFELVSEFVPPPSVEPTSNLLLRQVVGPVHLVCRRKIVKWFFATSGIGSKLVWQVAGGVYQEEND